MCSSMDVLPPLTAQFLDAVGTGTGIGGGGGKNYAAFDDEEDDKSPGMNSNNNNGQQVLVGLTASFTNSVSFHNDLREEDDEAVKNSRCFVRDPWSNVTAGTSMMMSNNVGLFGGDATNNSILKGISSSPSNNTMNTLSLSASTPTVPSLVRHRHHHHHHHQSLLSFVEPPPTADATTTPGTPPSPFPLTSSPSPSPSPSQQVLQVTSRDIPAFIFVPVQSMDSSSPNLHLASGSCGLSPSKLMMSRFHYNDDINSHEQNSCHIHAMDENSNVDAVTTNSSAAAVVVVQEDDVSLLADNPDEDDQDILPRSTCDVLANTGIFDEIADGDGHGDIY